MHNTSAQERHVNHNHINHNHNIIILIIIITSPLIVTHSSAGQLESQPRTVSAIGNTMCYYLSYKLSNRNHKDINDIGNHN